MKPGEKTIQNEMVTQQIGRKGQAREPVKLHIEELVLGGFSPSDRHRIAEGVQGELVRLADRSSPLRSLKKPLAVEHVMGGTFTVKADSSPKTMASQIALAIYQGLQRGLGTSAGPLGIRRRAKEGDGSR